MRRIDWKNKLLNDEWVIRINSTTLFFFASLAIAFLTAFVIISTVASPVSSATQTALPDTSGAVANDKGTAVSEDIENMTDADQTAAFESTDQSGVSDTVSTISAHPTFLPAGQTATMTSDQSDGKTVYIASQATPLARGVSAMKAQSEKEAADQLAQMSGTQFTVTVVLTICVIGLVLSIGCMLLVIAYRKSKLQSASIEEVEATFIE